MPKVVRFQAWKPKVPTMSDQLSNISRLEKDLWEATDNVRANSKLTSTEYRMAVLGIISLRHAATGANRDGTLAFCYAGAPCR